MIRLVTLLVILFHGVGHILFLVPLLVNSDWGQSTRSWLLGGEGLAKIGGGLIWLVVIVAYAGAGISLLREQGWWRNAAVIASVVSLVGLILFWANPASSSAVAALVVDIAILVALLLLKFPSVEAVGA